MHLEGWRHPVVHCHRIGIESQLLPSLDRLESSFSWPSTQRITWVREGVGTTQIMEWREGWGEAASSVIRKKQGRGSRRREGPRYW
jgi:hypothetical protein